MSFQHRQSPRFNNVLDSLTPPAGVSFDPSTNAGWYKPVNQPQRANLRKLARQMPPENAPPPLRFSEAPYLSYWDQPTNELQRANLKKLSRQQPPENQPPPLRFSEAPYLSYWVQPTNEPLRSRIPRRQQPKYPPVLFDAQEPGDIQADWVQPTNQPLRKRVPKRLQVNKAAPPFPPLSSQAPYLSYWKQPVEQFLRKRTPKRLQVNKFQPPYPNIPSQAPYLSYWVQSTNQPQRNHWKGRPQPLYTTFQPFNSIPTAPAVPSVAGWVQPTSEPLKSRTPKRLQFKEIQPPFPPIPSAAPYLSYWKQPVEQLLRKRISKRQQPQYPMQIFDVQEAIELTTDWVKPTNQPIRSRTKRQQPRQIANPFYSILAITPNPSNDPAFWIQQVNQTLRKRLRTRQQPIPIKYPWSQLTPATTAYVSELTMLGVG